MMVEAGAQGDIHEEGGDKGRGLNVWEEFLCACVCERAGVLVH